MKEKLKFKSDFAYLDIKAGRGMLVKHFRDIKTRIPVTITGYLDGQHSHDDGTSIEFSVTVTGLKIGLAGAIKATKK